MRLLRVVASINPSQGGVSQAISSLIDPLDANGITTEILCCDFSKSRIDPRFKIHSLGPGKYGYAYSPKFLPWLMRNISEFDTVIVDGIWLWTSLATQLAWKKSNPQPNLLIMPHGMLDPWFQRSPSRRIKAWRNSIYWLLAEKNVINSADALLFTSEEEQNLARQTFPGYKPRQEFVVGLGTQQPPPYGQEMGLAFRKSCPRLGENQYFLYLARIDPKKGIDLLVRSYIDILKSHNASAVFPALVIAGPGWDSDYGTEIQSLIASLDCGKNIHMVGMLEGDAKWGALYGCEAFILPSHQENFGIAVVEALACNKPVLISDKVNIWREIDSDSAGLVENDTFYGTRRLFQRYLQGEISKTGNQFSTCYKRRFDINSAATRLAKVIKELSCR